jgi:hypothetical protein
VPIGAITVSGSIGLAGSLVAEIENEITLAAANAGRNVTDARRCALP